MRSVVERRGGEWRRVEESSLSGEGWRRVVPTKAIAEDIIESRSHEEIRGGSHEKISQSAERGVCLPH